MIRLMDYADDINALAQLGMGPDALGKLASSGMPVGAFAQFRDLEPQTRALVIRLIEGDGAAVDELQSLPEGRALAQYVLTLPAYQRQGYEADD